MNTPAKKLLAVGLAAALGLSACGDDDDQPAASGDPTEETTTTTAADDMDAAEGEQTSTESPAATLRANLTSLLQEHVYLAGAAIEQAVDAGGNLEDPAVAAAVETLDANSVALADAIGSIAGEENRDAFLELWRQHIGFFVDYTLGRATGDQAAVDQALADLDGYQQAAGDFFAEITGGELPADAVVESLETHVATLTAAIDAVVAGDGTAFDKLREAAQHMPMTALAISNAVVAALPEEFPGDPEGTPAETRAVLTNFLQEHAYLAGIAIEQAVENGGDMQAPAVQAAVATLDTNSVALADVVGSVAGDENRDAFLELWRQHIGFFVDYTLGRATGDQAAVDQALADLDGYQQAAGDFFAEITGGEIDAATVVSTLEEHIATLTAAIDAVVAGEPSAYMELREAAQHMPMAAAGLSAGIVAATS